MKSTWIPATLSAAAVSSLVLGLPRISATAHAATIVDTCGQVAAGAAVLAGDLDCAGFPGDAITLEAGSSLDFSGFTLTAGNRDGVFCKGGCTVFSSTPAKGIIQDAGRSGVRSRHPLDYDHQLTVKNMRITGSLETAVVALTSYFAGHAIVLDSEIVANPGGGVNASKKVSVERSVLDDNAYGGGSAITVITDSTANGNVDCGFCGGSLGFRAKRAQAIGNGGHGFTAAHDGGGVRLTDCVANDNGLDGLYFDRGDLFRMKIVGGEFSGNGRDGIHFDDGRFLGNSVLRLVRTRMNGNGDNGLLVGPEDSLDALRLINTVSNDNGLAGVSGAFAVDGLVARGITATGNGTYGLRNHERAASLDGPCLMSLQGSTISENGLAPECGVTLTCADVAACEPPTVAANVVCESSYDTKSGFPGASWSVCSLD